MLRSGSACQRLWLFIFLCCFSSFLWPPVLQKKLTPLCPHFNGEGKVTINSPLEAGVTWLIDSS